MKRHDHDVIMTTMASQITSLTVVYSIVYSDVDQRKHQSSALLALCVGNSPGPVNSPHKEPVTRNMFPFDDVIMIINGNSLNTLRPRQNGRHFADDIFKCVFLNENIWTPLKISLKIAPKDPINNIPALVEIMAWRRSGDKPLSQQMMVSLPTHISISMRHLASMS